MLWPTQLFKLKPGQMPGLIYWPVTWPDLVPTVNMLCVCCSGATMNTMNSLRGSRSTLSRRHDKPWRISVQKAPTPGFILFLRASAYMLQRVYAIVISSVCPSVCLSVTWVDQSKAFEVRIMQFSHTIAPSLLFLQDKFHREILTGSPEWGPQSRLGRAKNRFSTFVLQYLENGARYDQSYYWSLIGSW